METSPKGRLRTILAQNDLVSPRESFDCCLLFPNEHIHIFFTHAGGSGHCSYVAPFPSPEWVFRLQWIYLVPFALFERSDI